MKRQKVRDLVIVTISCGILLVSGGPAKGVNGGEETFDVLQIGTRTFKNVTVTTKSKDYIFLLHADGMTNLKVATLPSEVLVKLGYPDPTAPKVRTNAAAAWAKQTMAKIEAPQIKQIEQEFKSKLITGGTVRGVRVPPLTPELVWGTIGGLFALYLFYCYCCVLICRKAGEPPGATVWIPLLQLFPLLRAARMSGWWFLAFFVPVLNLVAQVLWCVKIADARGKSLFTGILLILPVLNVLAFLYLAFSDAGPAQKKAAPRIQLMALETA
jgi:hypothetical protein